MGVIGCTLWMSSCKQAPEAQTSANYAIMKVTTADKELSTSYSATIRGRQDIIFIRKYRALSNDSVFLKVKRYAKCSCFSL